MSSDFGAAALDFELENEPGTFFAVSNANAQLMGLVLERATGRPYEDYLAEKLWGPIGAGEARMYMDREGGMPAVSCCYRATPRDWLRLGALLLADGMVGDQRLWPAGWINEMTRGSAVNPNYGYQIWVGNPPGESRGVRAEQRRRVSPWPCHHSGGCVLPGGRRVSHPVCDSQPGPGDSAPGLS